MGPGARLNPNQRGWCLWDCLRGAVDCSSAWLGGDDLEPRGPEDSLLQVFSAIWAASSGSSACYGVDGGLEMLIQVDLDSIDVWHLFR
jgi:hypothetical protein